MNINAAVVIVLVVEDCVRLHEADGNHSGLNRCILVYVTHDGIPEVTV